MLALSREGREEVDAMNETAAANGGTADINPAQDLGFMYNRNLADLDGHVWEAMWMDPTAIPSDDHADPDPVRSRCSGTLSLFAIPTSLSEAVRRD